MFDIVRLGPGHARAEFSCGIEALDRWLRQQAGQDVRRRMANCFVAVPDGTTTIAGFYALSATSILPADLAERDARGLPRYPSIPAVLVGRLATDLNFRGIGLGSAILADAVARALRADPMIHAVVVEAKDDDAARFYRHLGFIARTGRPRSLYLPLATAGRLFGR